MKSEETSWRHPESKLKTIFHRCKSLSFRESLTLLVSSQARNTARAEIFSIMLMSMFIEHVQKWRNKKYIFTVCADVSEKFQKYNKTELFSFSFDHCLHFFLLSVLPMLLLFADSEHHVVNIFPLNTMLSCQIVNFHWLDMYVTLFDSVKILTGKSIKFGENSQSSKHWSFNLSNGRMRWKLKGQLKFIHQKKWTVNMIFDFGMSQLAEVRFLS